MNSVQWGTVSEWASAAAGAAAVITAVLVTRSERTRSTKQLDEERELAQRAQEADRALTREALDQNERVWKTSLQHRRSAQASLVTVAWTGQSNPSSSEQWGRVAAFNHSSAVIVGCTMFILHQGVVLAEYAPDRVMILKAEPEPALMTMFLPAASANDVSDDERGLIFRDVAGVWWARLCSGALQEISGPRDPALTGCATWRADDG